jgi:hypothetical protein
VSADPASDDPFGLLSASRPAPSILGSTEPRLWTPPLRELTPETSYGFRVCEFARNIGRPLDPWQEWLVIHVGELLPDGRPRFRRVLVLVSRQNGKTEVLVILTLFWLFEEMHELILSTSTVLDYAQESWEKALSLAESRHELADRIPEKGGVRRANGQQTITTTDGCRYKIAASNRRGGRSLTIDRLVADELREQDTWQAYNAGIHAMNARPNAQAFLISNQGDDKAVVLKALRKAALEFMNTQVGDPRLGLFEWSAPDGSDAEDVAALAQANPNLNRRLDLDVLLGEALTAKAEGGEALAGFKTEAMCMDVPMMDPAIDPVKWAACNTNPQPMDTLRDRIALCLDVALDGQHATLMAAAKEPDGTVRLEVVEAWSGPGCTAALRRELPTLVARVKPRALGWFPNGPAAVVAADLADPRKRHGRRGAVWPPRGVKLEEIRTETAAVCMGLAEQVTNNAIAGPDDPMLNTHIAACSKQWLGATWVFARLGSDSIDGAYAAAGATHLARTLPPPPGRPRLVIAE